MSKEASGRHVGRASERRVLILHQSPLFRDVMQQLLGSARGVTVIGATTDLEAGLRLASAGNADTVILEAAGDWGQNPQTVSFIARVAQERQELRTIALSLSKTGYALYSAKRLTNIEPKELLELVLNRPAREEP